MTTRRPHRIGRRRLITRQDLEQFLEMTPKPEPSPAIGRTVSHDSAGDAP